MKGFSGFWDVGLKMNIKGNMETKEEPINSCCLSIFVGLPCFLRLLLTSPTLLSAPFYRSETVLHQFCCPAPENPESDTTALSR